MHVSPIGFKGTITVIDKSKGRTTYLESYHTSKKQDEELFRLAYNTLGKVGIKKDLATTDVVDFKNKLEQIMIKSLPEHHPNGYKNLLIGGVPEDYTCSERYNSAHGKIYYKEVSQEKLVPRCVEVIVDLMEPEERKESARTALKNIQKLLREKYEILKDERIDTDLIELSNRPVGDFQYIDKVLTKTLFYLDGNNDVNPFIIDPINYAPKLYNGRQAYLGLMNRMQKLLGTNLEEQEMDEAIAVFKEEKMEHMKRAIGYLDNIASETQSAIR